MPRLLLSSDFDPMQVVIIVIAVLAGFVKWLWENWQQNSVERPVPPPDLEAQRLRDAAWRRQTGQSAPPSPLPPVAPPSPWDELRHAWKELKETAGQAPPSVPRTPPRIPPPLSSQRQNTRQQQHSQQQQQQQQKSARAPQPPPPVASVMAAQVPAVVAAPPAVVTSRSAPPAGTILATLRQLRHDPALMRQAILMQEILGPPKALQSSRDLAI